MPTTTSRRPRRVPQAVRPAGTTWLHFVGAQYYTPAAFEREALRYGVTRRVSVQQLRHMRFGDRVLLAMRNGASAMTFGEFTITTLSGLSRPLSEFLARRFEESEAIDMGGLVVQRGCGSYVTGPTFAVNASMEELVAAVQEYQSQTVSPVGRLMIGGPYAPYRQVRLRDVPFRMGYRAFDLADFEREWASETRVVPSVRGQFYAEPTATESGAERLIQQVDNYSRLGE